MPSLKNVSGSTQDVQVPEERAKYPVPDGDTVHVDTQADADYILSQFGPKFEQVTEESAAPEAVEAPAAPAVVAAPAEVETAKPAAKEAAPPAKSNEDK